MMFITALVHIHINYFDMIVDDVIKLSSVFSGIHVVGVYFPLKSLIIFIIISIISH